MRKKLTLQITKLSHIRALYSEQLHELERSWRNRGKIFINIKKKKNRDFTQPEST